MVAAPRIRVPGLVAVLVSKPVTWGLRQPMSHFWFLPHSPLLLPSLCKSLVAFSRVPSSVQTCSRLRGVFLMTCHVSARDSRGSIRVGCAGRFPPCPAELVQVLPCVWCDGHVLAFSCEWDKVSQSFSFNSQISGSSRTLRSTVGESSGCDLCTPCM